MYIGDDPLQHLGLGEELIEVQARDSVPLDDLHDALGEELTDIPEPSAHLGGGAS